MDRKKPVSDTLAIIILCLALPLAGFLLLQVFLPAATWQALPLHIILESLGLFAGIALAIFILSIFRTQKNDSYLIWVASALIAMGILDGFHSALGSGNTAGWLHSLAMLAGGLLFSMVWLGDREILVKNPFLIPAVTTGAVTVLGIVTIFFPPWLPPMVIPDTTTFTPAGTAVNILAGLLFFFGAAALFRRDRQRKEGKKEIFLAGFCLLNGLAALLSTISVGWSASFWIWHLLRVSAYLLLFVLLYEIYRHQRIQAEHEVEESRERYRTLVETVRDWIWEVDAEGRYVYASPQVRDILGYEPDEIIGKTPFDLMPPDEAKRAGQIFSALILERKPIVSLENINIRKDGRQVNLETTGLPFFTGMGELAGYRGVDRDITERNRSELGLQQSNEALSRELEKRRVIQREFAEERRLFTGGTTVIFKRRAETGWPVEYVSPNVESQFGYAPPEFTRGSLPFASVIHPEDLQRIGGDIETHVRAGDTRFEQEYRIHRKDGSWRWIYEFTTIARDRSGTATHFNGYVLDITDRRLAEEELRKKHEELNLAYEQLTANEEELRANYENLQKTETALRESEQKFRGIIDNSLQFIGMTTTEGVVLEANRSALKFAGIDENAVLGKYFWDTPWWTHSPELQNQLKDAVRRAAAGETVRFEATHPSADGRLAYIDFSLKPVLDSAGNVVYLIPEGRDITERKKAEEALQLNAERNATLLKLNQMTGVSERELMEFAFEEGIRLTGSRVGYLATLNDDETVLTMQFWTRTAMEQCRIAAKPIVYPLKTTGLWGEAVRQRRPVITNDYAAPNPLKKGVPEGHVKLTRHMNIPVFAGEKIVLVTGVGNKEEDYNETDVQQLSLLMEGMWRIIERKRAEEALRASEGHLHTLVQTLPDLIWLKDPQGVYLACNPMFERFFGAKEAAILGKTDHDFVDKDLADFFRERDRIAMEAGGPVSNEEWITFADDGHQALLETIKMPMHDDKGRLIGVLGIGRDITARKKAADEIENARRRLDSTLKFAETVITAIPTPFFYKDREGRYIGVNDAFAELMGFTPEYYKGKTVMELWPGEYAEVYHEKDLDLMRKEEKQVYEFKVVDKNGIDHPVIWSKNVFRDENGEVAGLVGAFIDITDRKRAEDELKKYRDYLEEMVRQRTGELSDANIKLRQEISERAAVQEALNKRLVALTEPLESGEIAFSDLFNIDDIQKIQDAFADAHHVAAIITMPDGTPITRPSNFCRLCIDIIRKTEKGRANCISSDAIIGRQHADGPIIQPCMSGGLWDAGASIIVGGRHVASWLIGQVKNKAIDEEKMLNYARDIGADETEFRRALFEVPVMSTEQFEKVARVLFLLANELSLKAYQNVQQARFITGRRKAEEALRRSQHELADIINLLPDATLVIDSSRTVIAWNRALEELTGVPAQEMLGKGDYEYAIPFYGQRRPILVDLVFVPDEEIETKYYRIIQKAGDLLYAEMDIPDLNGKAVTLWAKAGPLYDDKGTRIGAIESIRDITEQKKIEKALTEAKERAEVANLAKSSFLSRMSHELRTPLNAILGFTQILRKQQNITNAQKRQLEIMLGSGEHLLGLISDLLDVGKIEEQKITLEESPFSLRNTLQQAISVQQFKAEEKGLTLTLEIPGSLPGYVRGDERRLRQIILNLLSNAIKFTKAGGIILNATYDTAGPGTLHITVTDTGIGIPQDLLESIFDPFTQVTEPGRFAEGAGLGLTITRQLVTIMGGAISVESEPGKGSAFHVEIPLPETPGMPAVPEAKKPVITGYTGRRRSILVVDDDITNTAMLVSALEPLGFTVMTADNGSDAVKIAGSQHPDLLLLDLVMPGMDGLDVMNVLKEEPGFSGTRIIGISAAVSPQTRRKDFIAACDDFIPKPVEIDHLLEKIRVLLTITWETAVPEGRSQAPAGIGQAPELLPPDSTLETMQQIVRKGDYGELEHLLDTLEQENTAYGTFCSGLRTFINRYDDEGIIRYLTSVRERQHDKKT